MSQMDELRLRKYIKRFSQIEYVNYITVDAFGLVRCFTHEPEDRGEYFGVGTLYDDKAADKGYVASLPEFRSIHDKYRYDNPRILWSRHK